jgi:hypothetical protein
MGGAQENIETEFAREKSNWNGGEGEKCVG